MNYAISGVDPTPFQHLYGLSDHELAKQGAARRRVGPGDTFPERSALRDAPVGIDLLLVNFEYQPARNPYHGCHAIFLEEGATDRIVLHNRVPDVMRDRLISLRAFDANDMIVVADVVAGVELEPLIQEYLGRPDVAYLHAHYAKYGCFAGHVARE